MLLGTIFIVSYCFGLKYGPIAGQVIDGETKMPLEGAIVFVQWTITHGIGFHSTELSGVQETITDKDGHFSLSGCPSAVVNQPDIVIYRKGYIAWRNDAIFPTLEKREQYNAWTNKYAYELFPFKAGYSFEKHGFFMGLGIMSFDHNKAPRFADALGDEQTKASLEVERNRAAQEEQALIECLKTLEAGKHNLRDICRSLSTIGTEKMKIVSVKRNNLLSYDGRIKLLSMVSNTESSIHKALVENGIEIVIENSRIKAPPTQARVSLNSMQKEKQRLQQTTRGPAEQVYLYKK